MVVNWTERSRYELADPVDPGRPYGGVQKAPATQGERDHGPGRLESLLSDPTANLVLAASGRQPVPALVVAGAADARPTPVAEWVAGSRARSTARTPDPNGTVVWFPLPAGTVQTTWTNATLEVRGNLTLHIYGAVVRVQNQTGNETYASGSTTAPLSPGPGPVANERSFRLLTIRATNARAVLEVEIGPVIGASNEATLEVAGRATLAAAHGNLNVGSSPEPLLGDDLTIQGKFRVETRNQTDTEPRLRGALFPEPGQATLAWGAKELEFAPIHSGPAPTWWWVAGAAGGLLLAGLVWWRRVGPVTVEAVELAFLAGRTRRAGRLAHRLAARAPQDADALFLYATAMLQARRFEDLVDIIEPLARRVAKRHRRGVAYLLAVAAYASDNRATWRRWAREAADDPVLRQRLREDGIWDPRPRRPLRSGVPLSGYA